jgi:hypothetical protein
MSAFVKIMWQEQKTGQVGTILLRVREAPVYRPPSMNLYKATFR